MLPEFVSAFPQTNFVFVMQAVFTISAAEFDLKLFEKIKNLFQDNSGLELVISVRTKSSPKQNESRDEYFDRLEKALENVTLDRDSVNLSVEEWQNLAGHKLG